MAEKCPLGYGEGEGDESRSEKPGLERSHSLIERTKAQYSKIKRLAPGKSSAQGKKMIDEINYHDYLCLDQILSAQQPMSLKVSGKMAHDEMLFITIHQTYEIWFKQCLHEVDSAIRLMMKVPVRNNDLFLATNRLKRVVEIQKILVDQIKVLETMTPLSFLEFREHLGTSSGFQSYQFRLFEVRLGLERDRRMNYGKSAFCSRLKDEQAEEIRRVEDEASLFDVVEKWLERTPMEMMGEGHFWDSFQQSVRRMFTEERAELELPHVSEEERVQRLEELRAGEEVFEGLFDEEKYNELIKKKKKRLSHKALMGALIINLYQEEALFHVPFELMQLLVDIDQLIRTWRYRHALMVHRMLGLKIGTGGSSGYHYLKATASQHMIFNDFFDISMYLIPRKYLPPMTDDLRQNLGFLSELNQPHSPGRASREKPKE